MYDIYWIGHDVYELHSLHSPQFRIVRGSVVEVGTYMVGLGIDVMSLEIALLDMNKRDMDAAHFGIRKSFMFSYKRDFQIEKAS